MTRKDYTRAAELLRAYKPGKEKEAIITFMCEFFRQDNPLFNATRFVEACKKA
jgi:hypothetical protein